MQKMQEKNASVKAHVNRQIPEDSSYTIKTV